MKQPEISVVIATLVGVPFIDECLASIETQAAELGADVIVVACGALRETERLARAFPWARVVHRSVRETVPQLRRIGVEQARAPLVAIIEEHCLAGPGWLAGALRAFRAPDCAAAGGAIHDHSYTRLVDWVVYFVEYNGSLPPVDPGNTTQLNGANVAYRRDVLMQNLDRLSEGYWEVSLHPVLLGAGKRFVSVREMVVYHRGPFAYGYYLGQRYWFSRAFAGARPLPLSRRAAYLVIAPFVPALLLARMGRRVFQKGCHPGKFLMAVPLLLPALTVLVAGEWIGYLAGPGDALGKVE